MKSKEVKREDAEKRYLKHELLTPKQKLKKLDQRLGVGVGATKERARLAKLINKKF